MIWDQIISTYDLRSCHIIWYGTIWYHIMLYDIILYDMAWYSMMRHQARLHDMISCYITWHDVIIEHIISYEMISCHMIWYNTITCDKIHFLTCSGHVPTKNRSCSKQYWGPLGYVLASSMKFCSWCIKVTLGYTYIYIYICVYTYHAVLNQPNYCFRNYFYIYIYIHTYIYIYMFVIIR
jgi:hypothetical protein